LGVHPVLEDGRVVDVEPLEELSTDQLQRADLPVRPQRFELPYIDLELAGVQLQRVTARQEPLGTKGGAESSHRLVERAACLVVGTFRPEESEQVTARARAVRG